METSLLPCQWCGEEVSPHDTMCPHCLMTLVSASEPAPVPEVEAAAARHVEKKKRASRKKAEPSEPVIDNSKDEEAAASVYPELNEKIQVLRKEGGRRFAIGIDPGARYTGISIRDDRGAVYMSSTYYREDEEAAEDWALRNVDIVSGILEHFELDAIGLEKTVDPIGFKRGKRDPLNPKDIIRTALVVGSLLVLLRGKAVLVRPRNNGNKEPESYPDEIKGQRPKTLAGYRHPSVSVRDHERSAYDVAATALFETR